jgi:two-component system osmolarity sensor histidine kinase EnvZ
MNRVTRAIKQLLPHGLFGRSLLIIVMPLILLQLISATVFYERHWDNVARRLASVLAGDIGMVVDSFRETADPDSRERVLTIAAVNMGLGLSFRDEAILPNVASEKMIEGDEILLRTLTDTLARPFTFELTGPNGDIAIHVQLPDGVLDVLAPRKRLYTSTTYIFVMWMVGSSLVLFGVAMIFMRNQVRPIRRLAAAADALGKGRDVPTFKLQGATEVRQAATAFNLMRDRLLRQISQRTEMLAGVSHDLRTPLTRMKLQLAMLKDGPDVAELKAGLNDDLAEMETMIDGYLAFARGEGPEEPVRTDLGELLADAVSGAQRAGGKVGLFTEGDLALPLRPAAFKRCLANLIGNAMRYGKTVMVKAARQGDSIEVTVDDDGPGIAPDRREEVFRPFRRLEESRNIETGGVGLGLTIARDVVHAHGGAILLEDSPLGGLRARLRLPV